MLLLLPFTNWKGRRREGYRQGEKYIPLRSQIGFYGNLQPLPLFHKTTVQISSNNILQKFTVFKTNILHANLYVIVNIWKPSKRCTGRNLVTRGRLLDFELPNFSTYEFEALKNLTTREPRKFPSFRIPKFSHCIQFRSTPHRCAHHRLSPAICG